MLAKHKIATLFALVVVLALSCVFASLPGVGTRLVHADPVPTCGTGATLVPAKGGNPAYCSCPKGQVLVTGETNTCASSCPSGSITGTSFGQAYCNPPDSNGNVSTSPCFADNQAVCNSGCTPSNPNVSVTTSSGETISCKDACTKGLPECNTADNPQNNCDQTDANCGCTSTSCDFVGTYVNKAIRVLSILVGVAAAISIIFAGIQYSSSGGDAQKVAAAKDRITKTLIGLIAYGFLFGFLQFIVPGGLFNR